MQRAEPERKVVLSISRVSAKSGHEGQLRTEHDQNRGSSLSFAGYWLASDEREWPTIDHAAGASHHNGTGQRNVGGRRKLEESTK